MEKSHKFEKYVAAVKMAELMSQGSGELNKYDHVAKDLHEPGFDEDFEKMPDWEANVIRYFWEKEINEIADESYKDLE
jgi:hypothetical protein